MTLCYVCHAKLRQGRECCAPAAHRRMLSLVSKENQRQLRCLCCHARRHAPANWMNVREDLSAEDSQPF
jgi:hypothetical protein